MCVYDIMQSIDVNDGRGDMPFVLCSEIITHSDKSHESKAFLRVCVCLYVSLHYRTKTVETTITKFAAGIVHHKS